MPSTRLSALDASFLRLEGPTSHMHVGSRSTFDLIDGRARPTVSMLRATIAGRLRYAPSFRQRLAFPPVGLGEPFWVDDQDFDLDFHVRRLGDAYEALSARDFHACADAVLSEPLDRRRPLWEVHLAPRLENGQVGLVMKMHHAMVDGMSAVKLALLLFAASPDAEPEPPDDWSPRRAPSDAGMALRAVTDSASESLRAARGIASLAGSPLSGPSRIASGLRRTALAVGDDLLRAAPSSYVNRRIGPQRTLHSCRLELERIVETKQRTATTHNDVCLAIVSGALREIAQRRGEAASPMKAMVPVSMRGEQEAEPGNQISFAFVELPLGLRTARARLRSIHQQTTAFKGSQRAAGTQSVLAALKYAPSPLKTYAARLAGSARAYNLTVSNVPGPRTPVYMLGARLAEAYPVVPLSDDHALSVGMFTYRDGVHFGLYADPDAFADVSQLPAALVAALAELERDTRGAARRPRGERADLVGGAAPASRRHLRVAADGH